MSNPLLQIASPASFNNIFTNLRDTKTKDITFVFLP